VSAGAPDVQPELAPPDARGLVRRAHALFEAKRFAEALASAERATVLDPLDSHAQVALGYACAGVGRPGDALQAFERALHLDPRQAKAHAGTGLALAALGRTNEAMAAYERAARLDPTDPAPFHEVGHLLARAARYDHAHTAFEAALTLEPEHRGAMEGAAKTLIALNRHAEAVVQLTALQRVCPDLEHLDGLILNCRLQGCDWTDFAASSRRLAGRVADGEAADMPWSFLAHCDSAALQRRCAESYVRCQLPPGAVRASVRRARPSSGRLRIGYVSADFREHPVAQLLAPVIECHDRSRVEIFGFNLGPSDDGPMRRRLAEACDELIDVSTLQDAAVAQALADRGIDIAIDLGGHTTGGRTRIFARRPAPLQVNFLGFPGTSGAGFMDYLIADEIVVPDILARHYTEKIIRLPAPCLPGGPPPPLPRAPSRVDAGLPAQGVVFCSFNAPYKLTPPLFAAWMQILTRVSGSVLWLGNVPAAAGEALRREAWMHGVPLERLVFAPRTPTLEDHVARLSLADVFLDTFPYNAHSSARDALAAGVPLITLRGESFASRVATSLLQAAGLAQLSVTTVEDYVETAVRLVGADGGLAAVKARLRAARETNSLFQPQRYCRHLESAYSLIWTRHQSGRPPDHVRVPAA